MKIAFAGKGGSGKTTLSSLFVRHLAGQGLPVVAIDADINQHLAEALGADREPPRDGRAPDGDQGVPARQPTPGSARRPPWSRRPRPAAGPGCCGTAAPTRSTTSPSVTPCGARLLATGPFDDDDLGVSCYHSKTGAVELYLNHLVDGPGEYVVVDCTAGADSFASGLFTRFDLTVLVAEPTRKGISVYRQWQGYSAGYHVALVVAGNKVQGPEDTAFLREHAAGDVVAWLGYEPAVRAMEQGRPFSLADLSPATSAALGLSRTGWTPAPGLGQIQPAGGGIPPQECPRLGQRRHRRGPGRADRTRNHPRSRSGRRPQLARSSAKVVADA